MTKPAVIEIDLSTVVKGFYEAATLGALVQSGEFTEGVVETPRGIDLVEYGRHILEQLEALPADHPYRQGVDLARMKQGLGYIESGTISVVVALGQRPVKGKYVINTYAPRQLAIRP